MAINAYLSLITLDVNDLNAPIKRHRAIEWIKKMTHINAVSKRRIYLRAKHTQKIESKRIEKDISCKWKWKIKAGVAILISDKIDCKMKGIISDK